MSNPIKSTIDYVRSSIAELKKVTWPTKEMTIRYTVIVVVASVALAGFFAVLDFGFSKAVTTLLVKQTSAPTEQQAPVTPDLEPISTTETQAPVDNGNLKLDLENTPSVE